MKEATGGALLMGLAAGIIIIFIIMVAFFISYGKSFKMKNQVINYIEQNEGIDSDAFVNFMVSKETTYNGNSELCYNVICKNGNPICSGDNIRGFTMEVNVYMHMDKTILGEVFNVNIPVRGETKIIETGNYLNKLKNPTLVNPFGDILICD